MGTRSAAIGSGALRSRGGVLGTAVLLALIATSAVYLYVRAERDAAQVPNAVAVLVATRDIPVGADLDTMISEGAFETEFFPSDTLVRDAVSDLEALEGGRTTAAVLEGQQMSTAFLEGGASAVAGGALGIPDGMQGVSVSLDESRVVGGDIRTGDRVSVYATFDGTGGEVAINGSVSQTGEIDVAAKARGPVTTTLVGNARVLKVVAPETAAAAGAEATTLVTLALIPRDVQRLVYAQENGSVWLGLLPPNATVDPGPPIGLPQVLR